MVQLEISLPASCTCLEILLVTLSIPSRMSCCAVVGTKKTPKGLDEIDSGLETEDRAVVCG